MMELSPCGRGILNFLSSPHVSYNASYTVDVLPQCEGGKAPVHLFILVRVGNAPYNGPVHIYVDDTFVESVNVVDGVLDKIIYVDPGVRKISVRTPEGNAVSVAEYLARCHA